MEYYWLNDVLYDLAKKQKLIDEYIYKQNNLKKEDTFEKRIIALYTEISEFVNELRSFKYWSKKAESSRNIILEEYIDCVHFILGISNDLNFDWKNYDFKINNNEINELILKNYNSLAKFFEKQTKENFIIFLNNFFSILHIKKISEKEFISSYLLKNKKNYQRQKNNY